jgi:hypothetical protein
MPHLFWSKQLRQVLQSCVLSLKIKTDENMVKIINISMQIQLFKLKQDCLTTRTLIVMEYWAKNFMRTNQN